MRLIMVLSALLLLSTCVTSSSSNPSLSELDCHPDYGRCEASLEQEPGHTRWFVVISSDCGTVETGDGKRLGICGGKRLIGNAAEIELKGGSCRVCVRKPR